MALLERILADQGWREQLGAELDQPYMKELSAFICAERAAGVEVYPPSSKVFNAFNSTPFDRVKVVIMGQDPYHGPNQAEGLSFSVGQGVPIPPSLRNMIKELQEDVRMQAPSNGSLQHWADQGVLLLNACLTVRRGQAHSHKGRGWERFTDAATHRLAARQDPMVFMLWGNAAKTKIQPIIQQEGGAQRHLVLSAPHPSPLSAHAGFFGCRHFSQANAFLEELGKKPIDWQIP